MLTDHTNRLDEQIPLLPRELPEGRNAIISSETFWKISAISGALAVALGAVCVYGLKKHISDPAKIGNWATATYYHVSRNL